MLKRSWCCLGLVLVIFATRSSLQAEEPLNVARDIRPILSNLCFKCHGFDDKERKAELRLDTVDGQQKKLDSGFAAIAPGKLEESELWQRINSEDPNEVMPPPSSGRKITAEQKELLKRWIEQGAQWQSHWSFIPPHRPANPEVKLKDWVRNEIDRFVLARLESKGMTPSAPADKTTLIRRVTFDLTGLPPTPAEVDAFLADNSADAYEKLVDRLLLSPRYGEHMARYWLDAARYGDTHGLHLDNERSLWPYREWVIKAFNSNMKFDQFTVEQLAGDLLPNATLDQRIASGFNRNNVTTSEGGSINEEVLVRYAVDRTEAVGTVFMGLTLGCAVCHNHKFDPISQKEFYQLYAFYNGTADAAMDGNSLLPPPVIKLPTEEQTAQLQKYDQELVGTRQKISEELAKVEYTDPNTSADPKALEPQEYVWIEDEAPPGAKLQGNTEWIFATEPEPVFSGKKSTKRTAPDLSQHFFTDAEPKLRIGEGDKLFAYVYLDPANPPKEIMLQWNDGVWEHRATWGEDVIPWGNPNSPSRLAVGPLPEAGKWVRLEVEAAKVGLNPGALVNGWAFTQHGGTCFWDKAGIVTRTPQAGQSFDSLLAWESYEKAQTKSTLPAPVQEALKVEADKRNDAQKKTLRDHFLENVCGKTKPVFDPLHQKITELTNQRNALDGAIPSTMVMAEMTQPRETFILTRGAYNKPGEKVTAALPAIFPPLPPETPANRLGMARWLTAPNHPLTARVTVNRFWQQFFGVGLVKTAEDFGAQGSYPTNPELLDWMATEFIESGWDIKRLLKLIVMSNTYQQTSSVTPELLQKDPANELLSRGPRFRLDAEALRDTALFVSGTLVEKIGGKSVKPYQPEGVWEAVAFQGSNTQNYARESGEALYRRSLYTFWKRTSPPPLMLTFDAPSRETCTVRRARTNTPLQALALMNDVQFVEAARQLAQRLMLEGGNTPEERITFGYRVVLGRKPKAEELGVILPIYQSQLAEFQAHPETATQLLAVGESKPKAELNSNELASWTVVANLLLNLDEAVTKE